MDKAELEKQRTELIELLERSRYETPLDPSESFDKKLKDVMDKLAWVESRIRFLSRAENRGSPPYPSS
jgi:hypothetical protein